MEKKKDEASFMYAIPVDSLVLPFQCDWFWFKGLEGRRPEPEIYSDIQMVGYICR